RTSRRLPAARYVWATPPARSWARSPRRPCTPIWVRSPSPWCAGRCRSTPPWWCRSRRERSTESPAGCGSTPPRSRSCCRAITGSARSPRSSEGDVSSTSSRIRHGPSTRTACARPASAGTMAVMRAEGDQEQWIRQRREAVEVKEQALRAARLEEHEKATALIREGVERFRAAGIAPAALRARPFQGSGTLRTGLEGWYLKQDRTLAVDA